MSDICWLVFNEDGDYDGTVYAPDYDSAVVAAREIGCDGDFTVSEHDPRDARNARRRERYAERRAAGWSRRRPPPVPADFPRPVLGYMATLAVHDEHGRCRCPQCSRFCRIEDFAGSRTASSFKTAAGVGFIDYTPSCWRCRGLERAPYANEVRSG